MKKLFISQPMKGKTDEEILKEREKAIASAKRNFAESEEIEVIGFIFPERSCGCETSVVFGKIFGIAFYGRHCIFCKRLGKRKRMSHRKYLRH